MSQYKIEREVERERERERKLMRALNSGNFELNNTTCEKKYMRGFGKF